MARQRRRARRARRARVRLDQPGSRLQGLRGLGLGLELALLAVDGDAARRALLGLGDPDLEHAVGELRGDRLGVDALRQRERPAEAAERALDAVEALALGLVVGLALTRDGQDGVLELDAHVLLRHAG